MLPDAAAEYYRQQQRTTVATIAATRRAWGGMGQDFDASWRTVGPRLVLLTAAAQLGAARDGVDYIPRVLAETGQVDDPVAAVNPRAFAGVAGDGRPLGSLLYGAVVSAKTARVQSSGAALLAGRAWLDMAVQTAVADADRGAVGAGIAARPRVRGYVRMLNLPSCSRCAVLAGKWFGWNKGFQRHPRCDCRHIPAPESMAGALTTDPRKAIEAGQVTGLSRADRRAIVEDGADVGQIINAQRGMQTAQVAGRTVKLTTEGTTVRGSFGRQFASTAQRPPGERYRRATVPRLRPETIYAEAKDRADAIRLLTRFGYLT